jgi:hypothetical protein
MSLVERGANGGIISREDERVIHKSDKTVDVEGIDNHRVNDIAIVTAGAAIQTHHGPVTAIMNEYALGNQDRTIHSSGQPEWHRNDVNDRSKKVGRLQFILIVCDSYSSLDIVQCLPYMTMRSYTTDKYQTPPHVMLTSPSRRDLSTLNSVASDADEWYKILPDLIGEDKQVLLDTFDVSHVGATYRLTCAIGDQAPLTIILDNDEANLIATNRSSKVRMSQPSVDKSMYRFCVQPTKQIKKTLNCITQYVTMPCSKVLLNCDEHLN